MACGHLLCDIIGGDCSLAIRRTRGCRANATAKDVAPERVAEIRALLGVIDPDDRTDAVREAAVRLAAIVRREALDDRNVIALVAEDEPDLAPALTRLCRRA